MQLVTKDFAAQCLAFPDAVDTALAQVATIEQAKGMLDKAAIMRQYAERLKAGVEGERPIAIGVLKIKAKLGELMPATPPSERGRGKKNGKPGLPFSKPIISAYRKIAENKDRLDEYYEVVPDEVPTQTDFIRFCTGGAHVSNNSGVQEWYTPAEFLESARDVIGDFDLDPASSEKAQEMWST